MRQPSSLPQILPHAAGVDIGAHSHFAAVPPGSDPHGQDVREFEAFTADLYALADWLAACGVTTVAMESTGVYWIPSSRSSKNATSRSASSIPGV
jgi:transposase